MFVLNINKELSLALTMPYMAEEIFNLSIKNRDYLSKWMVWIESLKEVEDTKKFITSAIENLAKEEMLLISIIYKGEIVGNIDLHTIDKKNQKASIGYWLDYEHYGKGLMSKALKRLWEYAFSELNLNKLIILCDVENIKSCNVAKRVGFKREALLKEELIVNKEARDFYRYTLFKRDFNL